MTISNDSDSTFKQPIIVLYLEFETVLKLTSRQGISVLIAYAQIFLINSHTDVAIKARGLKYVLHVYANIKDSIVSVPINLCLSLVP